MDRKVIDEKLEFLRRRARMAREKSCVGRVRNERPAMPAAMAQTGILDRNLAHRTKKTIGFRNVAVHSYRSIDWAIVHSICQNHLDDFGDFAMAVVSHMERK
jgi:hypothetical protein